MCAHSEIIGTNVKMLYTLSRYVLPFTYHMLWNIYYAGYCCRNRLFILTHSYICASEISKYENKPKIIITVAAGA